MVIAALITLAVLLVAAGVQRFGADSRDGRDWQPTDDIERSHPWVAGFHPSAQRPADLTAVRLPAELGGFRPIDRPRPRS